MNRSIATAALLGLALFVTAPTDEAAAAGVAAPGALTAAVDQTSATVTPVHYRGYRRYYRPYYGYYRPYYGYRYYRPYYYGYGYARPRYYGYGYRW